MFTKIREFNQNITSFDISSDGLLSTIGFDDGECLIFSNTQRIIQTEFHFDQQNKAHLLDVCFTKFFPSNKVVVSSGLDMHIRIWDIFSGQQAQCITPHVRNITDLTMVGNGKIVLSSSLDGFVKKLDVGTKDILQNWNFYCEVFFVAYHQDWDVIFVGHKNGLSFIIDDKINSFSNIITPCSAIEFNCSSVHVGDKEGNLFTIDQNLQLTNVERRKGGYITSIALWNDVVISSHEDGSIYIGQERIHTNFIGHIFLKVHENELFLTNKKSFYKYNLH
eukprot:TRINITY_DN2873_c0_g4_i1.p1 TRINITY_DN2873_c0_g4~~TRINITY_DN2873_c0_g4_i1.p1  ORF type:complete len:278 (+),score=70.98 TRINITY_DN2873_c0_g4_i1:856-1689(+)